MARLPQKQDFGYVASDRRTISIWRQAPFWRPPAERL